MTVESGTLIPASQLINRAMRLLGQTSPGVLPTTDEYAIGLEALNAMMDAWRNDGLTSVAFQDEPFSLVAAQASYTIGTGGNFNTNRPVKIERAYLVDSNSVSTQIQLVNSDEYTSIIAKTSSSPIPFLLYYAPDMPLGHIYLYPVPTATYTLHLITWTPVISFASISTTSAFAPGWEDALGANLAVYLAPEFEMEASPTVMQMAIKSKAGLMRANNVPYYSTFDPTLLGPYRPFNILTGI